MKPRNAKEQRRENANIVTRIIQTRGPISRQQIAHWSGLSIPSVTNIVAYLEDLHLLRQVTAMGRNGKPIPAYAFDGSRYAALGLEFVRRHIYGVATDFAGNVLGRFRLDHHGGSYEAVLSDAASRLSRLRTAAEKRGMHTVGLGVASPGPLDESERRLTNPYGFNDWQSMPLADDFERILRMPTLLKKDTDLSAIAELLLDSETESDSLIYVKMEEGVGAAVVDRGRLYGGGGMLHSSLGHTTVVVDGERCECGNRGCLEVYTRQSRLERLLRACTTDKEREGILDQVAEYMAVGIANLVVLFGMEWIVIDGETLDLDESLFGRIEQRISQHAFPVLQRTLAVTRGKLGLGSAALGSALWIAKAALTEPELLRSAGAEVLPKLPSNLIL